MTSQERIKKIKSAHNRVVKAVAELKKLNCSYADSASDILLFDDSLQDLYPEDRQIGGIGSNHIDVDKILTQSGESL